MLALQHQLGGVVRVLSTEAQEEAVSRAGRVFHYLPSPPGLHGVPGQPKNWPMVWSTNDDFDLQSRLARLPFVTGGLGDITSDIAAITQQAPELLQKVVQIMNQAGPHLDTILAAVQDPALPQVIDRVKTLQALPSSTPTDGTASTTSGVGMEKLLPVLDTAIYVETHPAAKFALAHPVLVGVSAAVLMLGVGAGAGFLASRWIAKRRGARAVGRRYRRRS